MDMLGGLVIGFLIGWIVFSWRLRLESRRPEASPPDRASRLRRDEAECVQRLAKLRTLEARIIVLIRGIEADRRRCEEVCRKADELLKGQVKIEPWEPKQ